MRVCFVYMCVCVFLVCLYVCAFHNCDYLVGIQRFIETRGTETDYKGRDNGGGHKQTERARDKD